MPRDMENLRKWRKENFKKRYYSDIEASRARARAAYHRSMQDNPEKLKKQRAAARIKSTAKNPTYQAEYRAQRKDFYREYTKIYMREWRKNNKDRLKKNNANSYKKNPDLYKHHAQIRRARKANAKGSHTRKEWFAKVDAANWKCHYCGCHLDRSTLIKEHVVALSKGGADSIDNLVPACRPCNQRKHDSSYDEFMLLIRQ